MGMAENPSTGTAARRSATCTGSYPERDMGGRKVAMLAAGFCY